MASITPGEGGTFSGDTGEKLAFQALRWWQIQEENKSVNPLGEEYFTGSLNTDTDNKFFEGNWKIPAMFSPKPLVAMSVGAIYQGLTFSPGSGGTFVGETASSYTLEILLWLVHKQNDNSSNPDKFNYITAQYDANEQMWQGTFKLPYTTTLLSNGGTQDIARSYLL